MMICDHLPFPGSAPLLQSLPPIIGVIPYKAGFCILYWCTTASVGMSCQLGLNITILIHSWFGTKCFCRATLHIFRKDFRKTWYESSDCIFEQLCAVPVVLSDSRSPAEIIGVEVSLAHPLLTCFWLPAFGEMSSILPFAFKVGVGLCDRADYILQLPLPHASLS